MATKNILYGPINDWWLSDTISRWAGKGIRGFILPFLQWFTSTDELDAHREHLAKLNRDGPQFGITDNFYCLSFSAQNWNDKKYLPAWQDDVRWATVLVNFANYANFARTTGAKGLVFDTEAYTDQVWNATDARNYGMPREQLVSVVYQRGRQVMQALVGAYPGIQLILFQEGTLWWYGTNYKYELWPPFYNGLVSVAGGIHIGTVAGYPQGSVLPNFLKDPAGFMTGKAAITQEANRVLTGSERSLAVGMWPFGAKDYTDKLARYTPEVFKAQFTAAQAASDAYVWIYSHGPAWWQMTQAEIDAYGGGSIWYYTYDPTSQMKPTDPNIQSYFNVLTATA